MNIIVTGAARGIGAGIATEAIKAGHKVGIFDIDVDTATALAQQIDPARTHTFVGSLNVVNAEDWDRAIEQFLAFAGSIDVLVNNAGLLCSGSFTQIPANTQVTQVQVNTIGALLGCYKVKPFLAPHANAKVINLSSASAIYGQPDLASYAASKFFIKGLTEGLNVEWASEGIRCIDVMPLYVKTDMIKDIQAESAKKMGVKLTPEMVGKAILRLAETPNTQCWRTHYPIGLQAKIVAFLGKFSPDFINHWVHRLFIK